MQFNLLKIGSQVAEDEAESLSGYYLPNKYYHSAARFRLRYENEDSRYGHEQREVFFIGRTGSGKSAILEMLRQQKKDADRVLSINNDDFAIQLLLRHPDLGSIPIYLQPLLFKCLWKYVIITNVLKLVYGKNDINWQQLIDPSNDEVRTVLQRFDDFVSQQRSMTEQVLAFIKIAKEIKGLEGLESADASRRLHDVFRFLFNFEDQCLQDHVAHKFIYVLFDDLDREWSGREENVVLIKSLFECILDLTRKHFRNIRFIVALRTDIFSQIDFHQREKLRPYVTEISWSPFDLQRLIERRLRTFWNMPNEDVWSMFPDSIKGVPTYKYLITRTMWRPRDIINFVNLCIAESQKRSATTILVQHVLDAEAIYSRQRTEALIDEWKYVYRELPGWIDSFAGTRRVFKPSDIERLLPNEVRNASKAVVDTLFRIGFLGFRSWANGQSRLAFSFSSNYEAPIPNHELVINRAFDLYLRARAEELGQPLIERTQDADEEYLDQVENASIEEPVRQEDRHDASEKKTVSAPTRVSRTTNQSDEASSPLTDSRSVQKLFFCYARNHAESGEVISRVHKILSPISAQGRLDLFIDRRIEPGKEWRSEIQQEIDDSNMALLLLSNDFFSSEFIRNHELPLILSRYRERGVRLLPFLVQKHPVMEIIEYRYPAPVDGPYVMRIADLQMANDKAYSDALEAEREQQINSLCERIVKSLVLRESDRVR